MTCPHVPLLRERADAYSRDAEALRHAGHHDEATAYEVIRDELRKIAEETPHD